MVATVARMLKLHPYGSCREEWHVRNCGPNLPALAVHQVGSYPEYTGRDANLVGEAALALSRD